MSNIKHFDIVNFPRHDTLRLMAGYLQSVIEQTDKMPETRNELTRFHAKSIPTIDIMAYLNRILKYAPCENDCFLSVLVYFNRMATLQNKPPSFVSSCKKRRKPIIINSYNIHRLLIIGIMIAAKFYSDIFFTNSHYAKVGGLPVLELNQLEIEFLLINDFDLHISVEEIQETGDLLINHQLKYPLKHILNPSNDMKSLKSSHSSKPSQSSQQQQQQQQQQQSQQKPQKEISSVPPRVKLTENEESNRRFSNQPVQSMSMPTPNNNRTYNIQLNNPVSKSQSKRTSLYDEYNKDLIDSAAASIDSFDNETPQKYSTLNSVASMSALNNHRSPIPNIYTLQRTTSKTASAKLRNSMIMSMNSNIPLSSTNNSNQTYGVNNVNESTGFPTPPNSNYNNRFSYQTQPSIQTSLPPQSQPQSQSQPQPQPQSQSSQSQNISQQQILQPHQHTIYQTPQNMPQQPPPQGVLMESQYLSMYEQQLQQNEMMKKYNDSMRMSSMNNGNNHMMYKQNSNPNLINNVSYSTNELYNPKRMSTTSSMLMNSNNPNQKMQVYKQPSKSKSSSSLNVVHDWHNKELPPIKIQQRTNSSGNLHSMGNPHSANDILYQPLPPKPLVPLYNNSPAKMPSQSTNMDKRNNRLSVTHPPPYQDYSVDSPLDAPPRLNKFFGYVPANEIVSPIKISDDYQQDFQKMEDMASNFYLSPLTQTHSPSLSHNFSNLHINSNGSSSSNTPLRSYSSNSSTPNVHNGMPSSGYNVVDPSTSISPLAAKASTISISPTNNRYSLSIDTSMMNQGIKSLSSPLSAKANSAGSNINKRFSVQMVDRGHPNLTNSNGQSNSKHYSIQQTSSMSLKQFQATQSPPIEEENINNIEAFPQQNNVQLYINKSPINQNYR